MVNNVQIQVVVSLEHEGVIDVCSILIFIWDYNTTHITKRGF